jgi:enamine deaminase RidA (YjgF/YER057c/UK114 family)
LAAPAALVLPLLSDLSQKVPMLSISGIVYISGQVDWGMNHQVSSHTVEGQLKNVLNNLEGEFTVWIED